MPRSWSLEESSKRSLLNRTETQTEGIRAMHFNRFDVVEAWYLALSHCHGGQGSQEYRRLCGMKDYFEPSPLLRVSTLNSNAREIYNNAVITLLAAYRLRQRLRRDRD